MKLITHGILEVSKTYRSLLQCTSSIVSLCLAFAGLIASERRNVAIFLLTQNKLFDLESGV